MSPPRAISLSRIRQRNIRPLFQTSNPQGKMQDEGAIILAHVTFLFSSLSMFSFSFCCIFWLSQRNQNISIRHAFQYYKMHLSNKKVQSSLSFQNPKCLLPTPYKHDLLPISASAVKYIIECEHTTSNMSRHLKYPVTRVYSLSLDVFLLCIFTVMMSSNIASL